MIRLLPTGGLGNQMFQYAAARSLSLRLQCPLIIDLSFYRLHGAKDWARNFELSLFDLPATVAESSFTGKILCRLKEVNERFCGSKLSLRPMQLYCDRQAFRYGQSFAKIKSGTTLLGLFQNEEYFAPYRQQILGEFQWKEPMDELNRAMAARIVGCCAVSVHIRRGDYLTNASSPLAVLTLDYYMEAIDRMKSFAVKTGEKRLPTFFFFSDDIEWCRNQFHSSDAVFVDINQGDHSWNDMRLMAMCQGHIIANSSFSWWGAYLGLHGNLPTFAPKQWFKTAEMNGDLSLPQKWITI